MTRPVVRSLLVVGLSGLVPGVVLLSATGPGWSAAVVVAAPQAPAEVPRERAPVGMAGCAAAACHGTFQVASLAGDPDPDAWRGSAVQWLAADPHAKAYAALESDLGRRIMGHLHRADPEHIPASAAEYDRCLACHTNPTLAAQASFGLDRDPLARARSEGVGCEACHGNAGPWLSSHTAANASYPPAGMADLNDIGERAKVCAGCHVGAPAEPARGYPVARDMNHDMIAAGHPRLNFELTEYQRRLPPHWYERERTLPNHPPRSPSFEAKAWLVGRVAVAEAACELLADRAGRSMSGHAVWPEFAESNCFACHQKLVPESWRQQSTGHYAGRTPGSLPWQSLWPVTRPSELGVAVPAADAVRSLLAAFTRVPPPTASTVGPVALDTGVKLAELRKELSRPGTAPPISPQFRAAAPGINQLDWDEAAQVYLGLAALRRSLGPPYDDGQGFGSVRAKLSLKAGSDSPDDYSPGNVRSDLTALVDAVLKKADAGPAAGPK